MHRCRLVGANPALGRSVERDRSKADEVTRGAQGGRDVNLDTLRAVRSAPRCPQSSSAPAAAAKRAGSRLPARCVEASPTRAPAVMRDMT